MWDSLPLVIKTQNGGVGRVTVLAPAKTTNDIESIRSEDKVRAMRIAGRVGRAQLFHGVAVPHITNRVGFTKHRAPRSSSVVHEILKPGWNRHLQCPGHIRDIKRLKLQRVARAPRGSTKDDTTGEQRDLLQKEKQLQRRIAFEGLAALMRTAHNASIGRIRPTLERQLWSGKILMINIAKM